MQKTGSVELGDVSHDFNFLFCFVLFDIFGCRIYSCITCLINFKDKKKIFTERGGWTKKGVGENG